MPGRRIEDLERPGEMMSLNHFDESGRAVMVDVTEKQPTLRTAVASATVMMQRETLEMIVHGAAAKGDVLAVARCAGIVAAKKTPELIPLSHPLAIHAVSVNFVTDLETGTVVVESTVKAHERTGVEMEAMVSASIAALTIYDMCKAVEKGIAITETCLVYKEGGKGGVYRKGGRR
jgi:cyclic pyranopterin phosphate synthase